MGLNRIFFTGFLCLTTNALASEDSASSGSGIGFGIFILVLIVLAIVVPDKKRDKNSENPRKKEDKRQRQLEIVEEQRRQREQEENREAEEQRRLRADEAEQQAVEKEKLRQEVKRREVLETVTSIVDNHASTLSRKKLQKVKYDDYGNTFDKEWQDEKTYFHKFVIWPRLLKEYPEEDLQFFNTRYSDSFIESAIYESTESLVADDIDVDRLRPIDFEIYCASRLKKGGWTANLTKASGDQGIDIIAERDGIKLVVQVKRSSSPVGNKAVQEAIAGKAFINANAACVVSNAEFTPAAKELANVAGVKLLHHSELTRLKIVRKQAS
jgi:restriction system protein